MENLSVTNIKVNCRHLAVDEQREDIAILLVEHGADLYFQNKVDFKLKRF